MKKKRNINRKNVHFFYLQEVLFFPQMKPDDPNKNKEATEDDKASNDSAEK